MLTRGFEKITEYAETDILLPKRQTAHAAGYDFYLPQKVVLPPQTVQLVPTGLKAYMQKDEVLTIYIRSSLAVKRGIVLVNNVGIIDADYYNNPDNEGHIMLALYNIGREEIVLQKNERVAQGIFCKYLLADDDITVRKEIRSGGFGSTN